MVSSPERIDFVTGSKGSGMSLRFYASIGEYLGPRAIKLPTTIIGTRSSHSHPNKKILNLKPSYNRVLDIGCGNGRHLIFPISVGIDADLRILNETRKRGLCLCGDGQNLPFRDDMFDLSLFCYSLEYMKDPRGARIEGKRVSKETFELIYPGYYSWAKIRSRSLKRASIHFENPFCLLECEVRSESSCPANETGKCPYTLKKGDVAEQ